MSYRDKVIRTLSLRKEELARSRDSCIGTRHLAAAAFDEARRKEVQYLLNILPDDDGVSEAQRKSEEAPSGQDYAKLTGLSHLAVQQVQALNETIAKLNAGDVVVTMNVEFKDGDERVTLFGVTCDLQLETAIIQRLV